MPRTGYDKDPFSELDKLEGARGNRRERSNALLLIGPAIIVAILVILWVLGQVN